MPLTTLEHPDAGTVAGVLALVAAASAVDGTPALSEHAELHLRVGGEEPARHVLARTDSGTLLGYAHVDPTDVVDGASAEVVVHPDHRRQGWGRTLVQAAAAASPDGRLRLWAHGDHAGAAAMAKSLGYERIRALWLMRLDLTAPLADPVVPPGVHIRPLVPGKDDDAWLAVNARAFAHHPEQGGWTAHDLHARMAEPWFDAAGFLVAQDTASGRMLGFHWTKVHGGEHHAGDATTPPHQHEAMGEVYVVGVDPTAQGRRLGLALTLAGLHHLRTLGLVSAMLYVESDNVAALRVYQGLGFTHASTDVMYRRLA